MNFCESLLNISAFSLLVQTSIFHHEATVVLNTAYLVDGLEHVLFFHILGIPWNFIIPTDESTYFSEGWAQAPSSYLVAILMGSGTTSEHVPRPGR